MASKWSLSRYPCFRQLLEVQGWIFAVRHLEGEELVVWGW